jgi:hypothetical protein
VRSHSFFRIKSSDDGTLSLKTRVVIHGNEDNDKELVRKDTESCSFSSTRFILAIAASFRFELSFFDVAGAYLQSGPIHRDVFVRLPTNGKGHNTAPGSSPNFRMGFARPADNDSLPAISSYRRLDSVLYQAFLKSLPCTLRLNWHYLSAK